MSKRVIPPYAVRHAFKRECDICGVTWLSCDLRRTSDGFWRCPSCFEKPDAELQAERAAMLAGMPPDETAIPPWFKP